ncbi:LysR family transcriptional regulator [Alkalicoccobacillus plakortidis]|uniref:LysR family transcriptional regulator n=1 Tax=Alkalicoccobacillus plakortidis TaxID=444060 RepID=A0ABT0XME0_9BACI|nr:LysR family transcriptional regulator [Alkalicoccobacillus plakortidis]MCM2676392.1 LysR family transcriptional regulator [Alkalicoccobacillus plakortidis]
MDIKQLRYFKEIVEQGNISAAAEKLYMSQPPLSQQLRSLEQELDTLLFHRHGRRLELTEAWTFSLPIHHRNPAADRRGQAECEGYWGRVNRHTKHWH